jgi:hypothetical protein
MSDSSWGPPVWPTPPTPAPPPPPPTPSGIAHRNTVTPKTATAARTPNRWRKWTLGSFAVCSLAIIATSVIFAADPAPGGWINKFQRDSTTDTFEVELNAPARAIEVTTLDYKTCVTVASGVQKFTMACPTQAGQKWSLAITRRDGTVDRTVWNRDRFWILPLLIGAFVAAALSAIATIIFAILGIVSTRPPKPKPITY